MADSYIVTGDLSLASYVQLETVLNLVIDTYDVNADTVVLSLANVDYTANVLTADDIDCQYVVTGICDHIVVYDSNDVSVAVITKDPAIDLADTEHYTIDWPTEGIIGLVLLTFAEWQTASSADANSMQEDPLFADPQTGAYRLRVGSPCLGTGEFVTGLTVDMKGDPYFDETHGVSMGAINLAPDVTRVLL